MVSYQAQSQYIYFVYSSVEVSKAWHCHCNLCHEKSQRIREKAKANKGWTMFKYLCEMISRSLSCIVGWMLVAVLLKQLKEAPVQALSYDPYAILGLESVWKSLIVS